LRVHDVVDLKKPLPKGKQPGRNLAPPQASRSRAARFFTALVTEIEHDLAPNGKRQLSRIESELIRAFAVRPPPASQIDACGATRARISMRVNCLLRCTGGSLRGSTRAI
jgi:hypothetical protein